MLASREAYQRFKPYFNIVKIEDSEQYEVDTETRRLYVIQYNLVGTNSSYIGRFKLLAL
jgi:hypothetical protein